MQEQINLFPCCMYHNNIISTMWSSDLPDITHYFLLSCGGVWGDSNATLKVCCNDCLTRPKLRTQSEAMRNIVRPVIVMTAAERLISELLSEQGATHHHEEFDYIQAEDLVLLSAIDDN